MSLTSATPSASVRPLRGTYLRLLVRGLLAGLLAGLAAGVVAFFLGEPHIEAAIALEEHASHDHGAHGGHSHGDDALVSRTGQQVGLFLATGFAGMSLGVLYASVLYAVRRHSRLSGPALALVAAGLGWAAIAAVPFVKYPANPPAVGVPETIDQRTLLWVAAVLLGLVAVTAAVALARALPAETSLTSRIVASLAVFLAVVCVGYLALPHINDVGEDFPATLLWEFRMASLATQASLWLVLGLAFAWLTERFDRRFAAQTVGVR
ncbi:CbtA family protein [Thermobifida fusca]|uniref:Cobalt transporter CbtA n=1 Tax=Thermobifida fusca (strain YX) TaxID=269800 RepID=Q47T71_THEFY|nr:MULTISPECIES: CbtA family protein [Thermobifida]AAZ54346.1 conserved hypothetical protein [Thermobifida fusca YX]